MAPTWRAMRAVALEVRAHRFVSLAYFVQVSLERFDCDVVRCGGLLELFECFFCRFSALRGESSRRSTVRNTFSAAAALAAGGVAGDRLLVTARFALAGFGLRGRRVADFFVVGFLLVHLRVDDAVLVAVTRYLLLSVLSIAYGVRTDGSVAIQSGVRVNAGRLRGCWRRRVQPSCRILISSAAPAAGERRSREQRPGNSGRCAAVAALQIKPEFGHRESGDGQKQRGQQPASQRRTEESQHGLSFRWTVVCVVPSRAVYSTRSRRECLSMWMDVLVAMEVSPTT